MNNAAVKFNQRAFASIGLACSAVALPFTGYANHAYQFADMTVTRHAWMAAHNSLGVAFTGFALWHIVLNRRVLLQHVRGAATRLRTVNREALAAFALVAVTTGLATAHAFLVPTP